LVNNFYPQLLIDTPDFNDFINQNNIKSSSDIFNALYQLFNNSRQFKNDGKLGSFKECEAA